MERPVWIKMIRSLLMTLLIAYTAILVVPVVTKGLEPKSNLSMMVPSTSKTDVSAQAYRWIAEAKKMDLQTEGIADVLVITSGIDSLDEVLSRVDHNLVIGELLVSDKGESSQQDDVDKIEQLFDIHSTGWSGRYFEELGYGGGIPERLIEQYERGGVEWHYSGSGLVLVNAGNVMVLETGKDLGGLPVLIDKESETAMPYHGWFEVLDAGGQDEVNVPAEFSMSLTAEGERKLTELGLPKTFPAIVERVSALCMTRYHAGDFGGTSIGVPAWHGLSPWLAMNKGIYDKKGNEEVFWKRTFQWTERTLNAMESKKALHATVAPHGVTLAEAADKIRDFSFATSGMDIVRKSGTGKEEVFFINGVNLGTALPGKFFTEMPLSYELYRSWLSSQATMGINTVRVYTLLPPMFYRALDDHNRSSAEKLYLLQEIWPDEHPQDKDYLNDAYDEEYRKEIKRVVGAINGDVTIPPRQYKAYGNYAYDVSGYLIGYLVGRELEPEEVLATNERHSGYAFEGDYLYSKSEASATEAWLASSCEDTLNASKQYGSLPLVAIVSWPPLDVIDHESGWSEDGTTRIGTNDVASVDIKNIGTKGAADNLLFGAYHIYPNYPDFINDDPEYASVKDGAGTLRYKGYLKAFMENHEGRPAIVAEYGLSNSMTTAHVSPDGLDHGGLSETQQAEGLIRLHDAIADTGYAGAVIFQWIDEWAKKTWITEPYMIPYSRHPLWHNVMDPEQNYGVVAVETMDKVAETTFKSSDPRFEGVTIWNDHAYLVIEMRLKSKTALDESLAGGIDIGISTIDGSEMKIPEFKLELRRSEARLTVKEGYDWTQGKYDPDDATGQYEEMVLQTNNESWLKSGEHIAPISINLSNLNIGDFSDSRNQVVYGDSQITVRLPYMLLGISDPSSLQVLDDPKIFKPVLQDQLETESTEGVTFIVGADSFFHTWKPWNSVEFKMRPKAAYDLLREFFTHSKD